VLTFGVAGDLTTVLYADPGVDDQVVPHARPSAVAHDLTGARPTPKVTHLVPGAMKISVIARAASRQSGREEVVGRQCGSPRDYLRQLSPTCYGVWPTLEPEVPYGGEAPRGSRQSA
jgi:hypothetical protein